MSNDSSNQIYSDGTPREFEPIYLSNAGRVGPYDAPAITIFPTSTRELEVVITGSTAGKVHNLGEALPIGCIITAVRVNGHNLILPGTTTTYQLGLATVETGPIVETLYPLAAPQIAQPPPAPTETINSEVATVETSPIVQPLDPLAAPQIDQPPPAPTETINSEVSTVETDPIVQLIDPLAAPQIHQFPPAPTATINSGVSSVAAVYVSGRATFPILVTPVVGDGDNADTGSLTVKIVYFCP